MISLYDRTTTTTKTDTQLGFSVVNPETDLPGLPESFEAGVPVAGRHGVYDFGGRMEPVVFMFRCVLENVDSQAEVKAALRTINAFLLDGWGYPKKLELKFDYEPDKAYQVRYGGDAQRITIEPGHRRLFILPLIAHDPIAYGEEVEVERQITESPQSEIVTVDSGLNVPLTMILDNEGADVDGFSFRTFELVLEWTAT